MVNIDGGDGRHIESDACPYCDGGVVVSAPKFYEIEREVVPMYEVRYMMTRNDEHGISVAFGVHPEVFAVRKLRDTAREVLGEFPSFHQIEARRTVHGLEVTMFVPVAEPPDSEAFRTRFRLARDGRRCLVPTSDNSSAWDHDA